MKSAAQSPETKHPIIITRKLAQALVNRPEDDPVAIIDSVGGDGFTAPLTAALAFHSAWHPRSPPEARRSVMEEEGELHHYLAEHEDLLWREARRRGLVLSGLVHLRLDLSHSQAYVLLAQLTPSTGIVAQASLQPQPDA